MDKFESRVNIAKDKLNDMKTREKVIEEKLDELKTEFNKVKKERKINNKISLLLNETTKKARERIITPLESMATLALRNIVGELNSEIKIDLTEKSGKPYAEIKLEKMINNEKSSQDIVSANGGGYADTVSAILRQIFMEETNEPVIQGASFLDEPSKMVDAISSGEFANFLKTLSVDFNRQNIIVTHDSNIMNVADKCYYATQNEKGITSLELIVGEDRMMEVKEELEKQK